MSDRPEPRPDLLLGRAERNGPLDEACEWLRGKRVLVTGAAGSVGTPLAQQLARAELESLVLVDHHEYSLFGLERSMRAAEATATYELVDIRDTRRISRTFGRHKPEVVFHLAAAKHVPYGERFPESVVESNVLSTDELLKLADTHGVDTFVYPSSDKSVQPPSLYGATKRIAEALVQRSAGDRHWVIARFVNIIGTRGSVIETFASQIQDGQSLTLTDERMTRYWISMSEALWLLLQAGRAGRPGELLMPDCGDAIPVIETARRLASWYAPDRKPYPIDTVGIRPGERLAEVLYSDNESPVSGPAQGVLSLTTTRLTSTLEMVPGVVEQLRRLDKVGHSERLRQVAMEAAEALQ